MGIHFLEDACTSHNNFCSRSLCVYARVCVFVCARTFVLQSATITMMSSMNGGLATARLWWHHVI